MIWVNVRSPFRMNRFFTRWDSRKLSEWISLEIFCRISLQIDREFIQHLQMIKDSSRPCDGTHFFNRWAAFTTSLNISSESGRTFGDACQLFYCIFAGILDMRKGRKLARTLVTGTVKEMLQYYENITHDFRYDSLTLTPCIYWCLSNFWEIP